MTVATEETYLPDDEYNALVQTCMLIWPLLNVAPCPFASRVTEDQIKLALGEKLGIWPMSVIPYMDLEDRPAFAKMKPVAMY